MFAARTHQAAGFFLAAICVLGMLVFLATRASAYYPNGAPTQTSGSTSTSSKSQPAQAVSNGAEKSAPSSPQAATIYVDDNCAPPSDGTQADPYCTIQDGINAASAGDTVDVAPGNYNENVTIDKNDITLQGAGAGTNPTVHTVLDGASPANKGANPGIMLPANITGVTIKNLRVQNYAGNSGINAALSNNDFTVDGVHLFSNNITAAVNGGGLYMNGPVSNVLITNSQSQFNKNRGIVIWNGFKQNITITNNIVKNNNCCGIELQDGTSSGVTITGNTIEDNGDNGISAVGLTSGAGPNVIMTNTLKNNGRFGIEIKLPNGTGSSTGDGSIVVSNNTVERTAAPGAEVRDLAGIAVYRRGYVVGNNNVDIPTGVIVRGNTVKGYQQPSQSDGFGIVVEGLNMQVLNNTLQNNDVGVQRQAGHTPYAPNTATDGDQSNLPDQYFGRGNSPVVCASVQGNTFTANTVNTRDVGPQSCADTPTPTATTTSTSTATRTNTSTITPQPTNSQTATNTVTSASPTATSTACPIQFQDVPPSDEVSSFYPYVRCLACRGVFGGYPCGGTNPQSGQAEPCGSTGNPYFRPNNLITRGQIAKVVSNSAGFNEDVSGQTYADVPPSDSPSSFYVFIERLTAHNVMSGYPCGQRDEEACDGQNRAYFRPSANATRAQLAKIVSNAAEFTNEVQGQTFTDVPPPDEPNDPSSFYLFIERLAQRGVMGGYPCGGTPEPCDTQDRPYFRPSNPVTRAQSAKIVANTFYPSCQTR